MPRAANSRSRRSFAVSAESAVHESAFRDFSSRTYKRFLALITGNPSIRYVSSFRLMRGAVAAQFEGVFEPYFRAAYHHMWEEPKKMDDLETFRNAFISSGIDIDRLIARAQQDDVKKGLIDRTTDAVGRGAFGSPTFFVGKEMFFGKDQLRDVEESIVEQTSQLVPKTA